MTIVLIRSFFIILSGFVGYYIGTITGAILLGTAIGLGVGALMVIAEKSLYQVSFRGLSGMVFGLLLGIFMAKLLSDIIMILPIDPGVHSLIRVILTVIFSYFGTVMSIRGKDEFHLIIPYVQFRRTDVKAEIVILDTSAIIDGRVMDIYRTKFLSGRLIVPRFVLLELQQLSDSADDIKRQRGRRGMELLQQMQASPEVDIRIHEDEMGSGDVDTKLIKLAKVMEARICTTDYNLTKVGELQSIAVLNLHHLANVAKANFFTGEEMEVQLIKQGKEQGQAVAYLDDGTMIVVRDGADLIGERVNCIVTSVLQTSSGKMIFADLINE